jgi:hypothetical protein
VIVGASGISEETEHVRAFLDLVRLPAGGGSELVYAPFARSAHLLRREQANLLAACRQPAPLEAHAARIAAAMRPGGVPVAPVLAELRALAAQGLLVSDTTIVRALRGASVARPPPPPITTLAIPTSDRLESLCASLSSYIADGEQHGRALDYLVVDSSERRDVEERTRAAMRALRAQSGARLAYAGRAEKARFAAALAAQGGFSPELMEFTFFNTDGMPFAAGGNRNAILLHTVGELLLMVDDDTHCPVAPIPGHAPGLALTSQLEPSELWFPAPGERAFSPSPLPPRSFVSIHEELLGKDVGTLALDYPGGLDLDRADGMFLRRLDACGGRVSCTQTGGAGDSGTGSMWHYLILAGASRARLHRSEALYRHAFTGRQVVRAATRATIGDGAFCMGMGLGIDNRRHIPPFMPITRNGDGLFACALRLCVHDAYLGFLPWVVEHLPPEPRSSPFEELWSSLRGISGNDILVHMLLGSHLEVDKLDPDENLRALGATLERWARLPAADFEEIARLNVLRARAHDLVTLDEILRRHQRQPAYWADDIERAAAAIRAVIASPSSAQPADLVQRFGEAEGRALFQRQVLRFGELLRRWPDIVEAARALREKGVRLVEPDGAG